MSSRPSDLVHLLLLDIFKRFGENDGVPRLEAALSVVGRSPFDFSRTRGDREGVLDRSSLRSVLLEASRSRFLKIPARTRSTSFSIPPPAQEKERRGGRVSKGEKGV